MMGFLRFLVLAPFAALLVLLGVANRQTVKLVLDPFSLSPDSLGITLPLFVLIFGTLMIGTFLGYVIAWFGQRGHRKAERQFKRECERLTGENDRLKQQVPSASISLVSPSR